MDGADKQKFYIFDFRGNFVFFRMNKGKPTANMMALQGTACGKQAQREHQSHGQCNQSLRGSFHDPSSFLWVLPTFVVHRINHKRGKICEML